MKELQMKNIKMSKGAQKAFDTFTHEWQQASAKTFNRAGAEQAVMQRPELCETGFVTKGKQKFPRPNYRLKGNSND